MNSKQLVILTVQQHLPKKMGHMIRDCNEHDAQGAWARKSKWCMSQVMDFTEREKHRIIHLQTLHGEKQEKTIVKVSLQPSRNQTLSKGLCRNNEDTTVDETGIV